MKVHRFEDEDLRILATLAIDLCVDGNPFKVVRQVLPDENYWSFDIRFSVDESELDTNYDSLHIDCGRDNEPDTYQMCVTRKRKEEFNRYPITSPLLVVHYFEEMCGKAAVIQN